jgi:hypothetical protein
MDTGIVNTLTVDLHELTRPSAIQQTPIRQ